jgi:NADH dehydrogenase FAD-containing subunit
MFGKSFGICIQKYLINPYIINNSHHNAYNNILTDTNDQTHPKSKIIILGNGWAGSTFANKISKSKYDILLLDKNNYMLETHQMSISYSQPIKSNSKSNSDIKYIKANIKPNFSKPNKCVEYFDLETSQDKNINYDYLIFALGSCSNTFGIKGVDKYCLFYKTLEDWEKITKLNNKSITIIGGGPSGIELGYKLSKSNNKIIIIEAMDILAGFSDRTKALIKSDLEKKNITLLINTKVNEIQSQSHLDDNNQNTSKPITTKQITIISNNLDQQKHQDQILSDHCIWTAGIKQHDLKPTLDQTQNSIFLIGDNSIVKPYTAQKAVQEAEFLAKYFNSDFDPKYSPEKFIYTNYGKMISTSDGAYIELNNYLTIWINIFIRDMISKYLSK